MNDQDGRAKPRARNTRRAWLAGAGAAALGAGGWLARQERATNDETISRAEVWNWTLERPDGTPLSLAPLRATGLVLNFWATWCPPCLREFPELERFEQTMRARGWRVVGVAVDQVEPVRAFLAKTPVSFAIGIGGFDALAHARTLGNVQGGLPFTAVFAPGGALLRVISGETTHKALIEIVNGS